MFRNLSSDTSIFDITMRAGNRVLKSLEVIDQESTSSNKHPTHLIIKKTIRLQPSASQPTSIFVDIPVNINGRSDQHTWKLEWKINCTFDGYGNKTNTGLDISLTAKAQPDSLKYAKSHYEVKIFYNNQEVLTKHKGDMREPNYNSFYIISKVPTLKKDIFASSGNDGLLVYVTLCSYPEEMSKSFEPLKRMLDLEILTDVVIKTRAENIKCHKFVLASESDYFRVMFESDMKERNESVVDWVDVFEADTVKDMLHYVYTGQTPPNITRTCVQLIQLSQMCLMEDFKKICAGQIREVISVDNMVDILKMAAKLESSDLQELVINFMVDNYDVEGKTPAPWEDLEPPLAKIVLSSVLNTLVIKKLYI